MKRTIFPGKLNLNKQTISVLNNEQTTLIKGGVGGAGEPGQALLSIVTCNSPASNCKQCNTCCKNTFCSKA